MKKIAICTNTFGNNFRQDLSLNSINTLKNFYPNISTHLLQYEEDVVSNPLGNDIERVLTRSSKDLFPNENKKIPFVNDLFEQSSKFDSDFFMYINSDIILNNKIIDYILLEEPEAVAVSRMDIEVIEKKWNSKIPIKIRRIESAGYDCFIFSNKWYENNKFLFKDMFLGRPAFDNCYAAVMALYSKNIWNNRDELIYHQFHQNVSFTKDVFYDFNYSQVENVYKKEMKFWGDVANETIHKRADRKQGTYMTIGFHEVMETIKMKEEFLKENPDNYERLKKL